MFKKALFALAMATALSVADRRRPTTRSRTKVALLTAKLNCLQKYAVYSFGDCVTAPHPVSAKRIAPTQLARLR